MEFKICIASRWPVVIAYRTVLVGSSMIYSVALTASAVVAVSEEWAHHIGAVVVLIVVMMALAVEEAIRFH